MATIIDGVKTSQEIKNEIAEKVQLIHEQNGKTPHLAAVLVGDDGASQAYVGGKVRACEFVGFKSTLKTFEADISEEELLEVVDELNADPDIDGYIVQLPLPAHISAKNVTERILPEKDVDGFHPVNVGRMVKNLPAYVSATPFGIMQLLERYKIETGGKHCVVIGRSDIVGTPISILLSRKSRPGNCTVTICHSRTPNIRELSLQADIVIAALGIPEFLTGDMVRDGVVVIDVGISRVADDSNDRGYVLKGDVKFDEVEPKASYITPVPGGVGPMTIAALLHNTLLASQKEIYK
jgi:methylenetetrahydrofolate dehydrogenase (NADP+)/methenyltetrahydrofolate cyclohydrolase